MTYLLIIRYKHVGAVCTLIGKEQQTWWNAALANSLFPIADLTEEDVLAVKLAFPKDDYNIRESCF